VHITQKEEIPVTYEVDIVVVGGGAAGVGAALKAAQSGRSVLVIEQMNCLGGIATAGWHGHICCYDSWGNRSERVVGGTCYDLADKIVKDGYGTYNGLSFDFEIERLKFTIETMAQDIGNIKILYYTQFSDVVVENSVIQYVIIQNKGGRQAIKTQIVIDATGDADVAARAGAPYEKGRPQDGALQPMTLMFQMGGVDYDRFSKFCREDYFVKYNVSQSNGQEEVFKDAQRNGDMEPFQSHTMGWWWCASRPDQMGANFTHIVGKDPTVAEDLTYATIEGRRQAYQSVSVFNKYLPGLENAWLSHTGALIGTRESRRIKGVYYITVDDLLHEREFDNSIGYGSFFIDIHNCTGPGMDTETFRPHKGFKYQIPYDALIPRNVENLLVAGRCISCDHIALGSLRVMPQCFLEGDAAGTAAAMAIKTGKPVRSINVADLQNKLREYGAIISRDDIVKQAVE
jgi:hypothetical protein